MADEPLAIGLSCDSTDEYRLTVSGELDVMGAPILTGKLAKVFHDEAASVVIDLRDLSFIDSTGLGVLISAKHRANATGVPIKMELPEGQARYAFEITGLADVFEN